jgi:hypothetical protein
MRIHVLEHGRAPCAPLPWEAFEEPLAIALTAAASAHGEHTRADRFDYFCA